jgi:hypothetical protein
MVRAYLRVVAATRPVAAALARGFRPSRFWVGSIGAIGVLAPISMPAHPSFTHQRWMTATTPPPMGEEEKKTTTPLSTNPVEAAVGDAKTRANAFQSGISSQVDAAKSDAKAQLHARLGGLTSAASAAHTRAHVLHESAAAKTSMITAKLTAVRKRIQKILTFMRELGMQTKQSVVLLGRELRVAVRLLWRIGVHGHRYSHGEKLQLQRAAKDMASIVPLAAMLSVFGIEVTMMYALVGCPLSVGVLAAFAV